MLITVLNMTGCAKMEMSIMGNIFVQFFFLLVFSLALAIVVSGYRDDDPKAIMRGIPRRMALFAGTVTGIAALAYFLGVTYLSPAS